jgi:hypothetical protein
MYWVSVARDAWIDTERVATTVLRAARFCAGRVSVVYLYGRLYVHMRNLALAVACRAIIYSATSERLPTPTSACPHEVCACMCNFVPARRAWPHGLSDASTPRVSARPSPCPHDTRLRILAAMPTRCVCQHGRIRADTEACLRTHASVPARYPCWHDARSVPALNHASMARGVLRQKPVPKRRAPSQHGPSAPLTNFIPYYVV